MVQGEPTHEEEYQEHERKETANDKKDHYQD